MSEEMFDYNDLSEAEWAENRHQRMTPKEVAKRIARILKPHRPDYHYLKKVFQHTRELLEITPEKARKRLPELLTDTELITFYEAVWNAKNTNHLVMIKLLIYTGIRNAELTNVQIKDVDLTSCTVRIEQGKGKKDRYVLFPIAWDPFQPEESARLLKNIPISQASKNESIRICSAIKSLLI